MEVVSLPPDAPLLVQVLRQTHDIKWYYYSLSRFTDAFSDTDSDSNPIPVPGSWDGNLNMAPCSMESSVYYNVTFCLAVRT